MFVVAGVLAAAPVHATAGVSAAPVGGAPVGGAPVAGAAIDEGSGGPPEDVVAAPLVLATGEIELRLTAELNVQRRLFARPLALAPDAWWGVSPRWTIGVIHSNASVDRIAADASLCLRRTALSTCSGRYRGGGIDVRFSALEGKLAVAPRLRLLIRDVDPWKPATTLGALARWAHGRFAIVSDPYVRLPLANRQLGNRAALSVPLWFAIQPARGWQLAFRTGYDADFAVFRDGGHVPIALEVEARVTREVTLGASGGWASLLGPQHDGKHAALTFFVDWRL